MALGAAHKSGEKNSILFIYVRQNTCGREKGSPNSDPKQSTGPYTHYPASYMDGLLDQESLFNRLDR